MSLTNYTINSHFTHQIATGCHSIGRFLTYPTNFHAEQIGKIIRPLKPGHLDQLDNVLKELAIRVLRSLLCIALLPCILLGITGIGLQSIASFASREFVLICPNEQLPASDAAMKKLKIGTFNAYMMPSWISIFIHNYSLSRERVQAAAQGVLESDVDVLCVQEMFDKEATDQFMALIKHKYPYIIYNVPSSSLKLGSGLLIASKFPIENPQYWEHSIKIGTERLSSKGTIAATIRVSSNQKISVFNTHLEAGLDDPVQAIPCRVRQLQDIQDHAKEYSQESHPSFLCGDMNIPSNDGSADLTKLTEIITVDPRDPVRIIGTLHQAPLPPVHTDKSCKCLHNTSTGQDVDYIGILRSAQANLGPIESSISCFNGASDHLAYIATFDLIPSPQQ